jgi:hypothetical protein
MGKRDEVYPVPERDKCKSDGGIPTKRVIKKIQSLKGTDEIASGASRRKE